MSAILAGVWPYLAAGGAAIAAFVVAYFKGRGDGAAKAETKALKKTVAAKDDQLEMYREATKAERDAAAMSEAKAREEALRWSRR